MNFSAKETDFRKPRFAGQFYPGNRIALQSEVKNLLKEADNKGFKKEAETLQALIVPHAGYVFSGKVAATAFAQIKNPDQFKRVFILASSHRFSFNKTAVYLIGNYCTPLGEIKVDNEVSVKLTEVSEIFDEHDDAHELEHSIEVQLPFLQHIFGEKLMIVPIIMGTHQPETCKKTGEILKQWFTPENLWIISSDFSHYPKYEDAITTDELTASAICTNNPDKLLDVLRRNEKLKINNLATSLCGWTSVLTLLYMSQGEQIEFKQISYKNSGDAERYGEKSRVVGYWSIGISRKQYSFEITNAERMELLEKARKSIEHFVRTGFRAEPEKPITKGILNEKAGAFVSIYIEGKLRGCIGGFAGSKKLGDLVQNMAASASCDRRFLSVQSEELDKMELEISVLSPLKKIKSVDEIEPGKHGIYIKKGFNSGTFLPQVAMKTGWSVEELLGHCAREKAGIGWEGWKTAEIFTYEAVIIKCGEETN